MPFTAINQIVRKIDSLAQNPYQSGIRKLTATEEFYRARVGDYRILYEINDRELRIMIVKIWDRKDIYDR